MEKRLIKPTSNLFGRLPTEQVINDVTGCYYFDSVTVDGIIAYHDASVKSWMKKRK